MTRALVIEPAGNLRGSERALLDFVSRMPNIETAVCCPPDTPIIAELEKLSVRTFPYFLYATHEKSRLKRLWAAMGVIRACYEFRPEVIHLNQAGCYRVALLAATLFNLPIVAHVRIFEDVAYLARRCPNPRRLRGIIAISVTVANELRRWPQLSKIPLHAIYDAYVSAASVNQSGLPERIANRVACIGRIEPNKGQSLLIDAIQWLSKNGDKNIDCFIIGDGASDFVNGLKAMAAQGAAASAIHWLGLRNDCVSQLRTCAVMVCPSHREALGRVIFEAWDAGTVPVACVASGGAAEIIAGADGGMLYAEQTSESLARALQRALRLPREDVARLTKNGRSWMSKHCDPILYSGTLAKILHHVSTSHCNSR